MEKPPSKLNARFFRTASGNEPVRDWLCDQDKEIRRLVGADIKTLQYGWPLGMPLVRKIEDGLWEVRTSIPDGIVRTLFTVVEGDIVLLHIFIKKAQKIPDVDLTTARQRKAVVRGNS